MRGFTRLTYNEGVWGWPHRPQRSHSGSTLLKDLHGPGIDLLECLVDRPLATSWKAGAAVTSSCLWSQPLRHGGWPAPPYRSAATVQFCYKDKDISAAQCLRNPGQHRCYCGCMSCCGSASGFRFWSVPGRASWAEGHAPYLLSLVWTPPATCSSCMFERRPVRRGAEGAAF